MNRRTHGWRTATSLAFSLLTVGLAAAQGQEKKPNILGGGSARRVCTM